VNPSAIRLHPESHTRCPGRPKHADAGILIGRALVLCGALWLTPRAEALPGRFELFDLASDPGQQKDLSKEHPEELARLVKPLSKINASVMADAPDWHRKQIGRFPQ